MVFDSASDLLTGLDHLIDRFEVIWVKNAFVNPPSIGQCRMSVGVKQKLPQVHISELHLHLRTFLNFVDTFGQKHLKSIRNVLWGCNIPNNGMDDVLDIIYRSMYQTDGQLLDDAMDEVARVKSEAAQAGFRCEEAIALMKESRGYANALLHARQASATTSLAIQSPTNIPGTADPSMSVSSEPSPQRCDAMRSASPASPQRCDAVRSATPGGFSDATTRSSTPQQHGGRFQNLPKYFHNTSRATTPQPYVGKYDNLKPALTQKALNRRALSARAERATPSNVKSTPSALHTNSSKTFQVGEKVMVLDGNVWYEACVQKIHGNVSYDVSWLPPYENRDPGLNVAAAKVWSAPAPCSIRPKTPETLPQV